MIERTAAVLDAAANARDIDTAFRGFRRFAEGLGFDFALIGVTAVDPETGRETPLDWRSTISPEEMQSVLDEGPLDEDPIFQLTTTALRPFPSHLDWMRDWDMTPDQRRLYEMSANTAVPYAIHLPAVEGLGLRWRLNVGGGPAAQEARPLFESVGGTLWLAGAAIAARLAQIAVPRGEPPRLSPRERECLTRLAAGERVDRIAERLGLSVSAVELYLRNARRKVGARTSAEAVARAVLAGVVRP